MVNWKDFWTKNTLVGLGLGQLLSLLVTSTGFSSSELAKKGINAPTSQSFLNYVCLALVYGSIMLYRRQALKVQWYYYVLLGLVDVEANFLDVHSADRSISDVITVVVLGGSHPIKGDLLVIAGATLYGVSNVSETFPFVGFSVAMFLFYSGVPVLLKISGSTMLNLSLLTSDMWAVLIRIFAYHEKVDWMYFVAFAAVAVGLIVYSGGDKKDQNTAEVADEEIEHSKRFDEEAGLGQPDQKEAKKQDVGSSSSSTTAAEKEGTHESAGKEIRRVTEEKHL
ncbi:hypothetical protein DH2020_020158 [Rehmannia glutinosa]|uniref:Uncharacterized protein n=1 Tax=Rehmannia glutinosa TaxID=99300 RepID=A0ABR0WGU3_REHGL